MKETLKFVNHSHLGGDNVTFRKGKKWAQRLSPGDQVTLVATYGEERPLVAEVVAVSCLRLCDIPRQDLRDAHDCRVANRMVAKSDRETPIKGDFQALCKILLEVYGSMRLDSVITAIRYRLVRDEKEDDEY